ncbi:MAG: DotU family type IV/VI secretion system protein [Phycisphaerales bacterium]|nr:MAG: DotU family type IV/VI secretion system protein [Phycisphaerales bacterium]
MTLPELCEPFFQYVCRLSRSSRMGCDIEMDVARNDIKRLLAEMKAGASGSTELASQYEKIELPLIFFVDFMVKESKLKFAYDWQELARERGELAGDEKFFDLLDAELAETGEATTERLVIYYACIGLGFTGIYTGQPDNLQRLMSRIGARVSRMVDADEKAYICPEAYEHVDTRDFVEPPGTKLVGIGIVLVGLIIVWAAAYLFLFIRTSGKVSRSLDTIIDYQTSAAVEPAGGGEK